MNIPIYQVDAFTMGPFSGNPAAVCPLDAWLDDDVMQNIAGLKARVFLLHGRDDNVIPCEQSERLYQQLKHLQKHVKLVVTPFIDHGDTAFHLRQVRDLARIIQGFSNYFRDLSRVSVLH